jgi:EmrB/QacA subfamily drug resistance transporter
VIPTAVPPPAPRFALAVPLTIAVALFMENLDSTVINTAIPAIARDLGVTSLNLSMAVSVYLLSLAVFIPVSGWMADRFGARTIFASAIALFTASSALCGASGSLATLVAARALQGLGGAMMMPVGRLVLGRSFAKRDLITAMTYVTLPGLVGPMVGPLVGGAFATYATWRWIFYINVPIGLAGIAFSFRFINNLRDPDVGRFDVKGFLLSGIGLAGMVLGLENAGRGVLPEGTEIALFAVAGAALLLYRRHAARVDAPVLDLSLFRIPTFRAAVVGGTLARIGFGATPFLMPLLLQLGLGRTPLESGAVTFTTAVGAMVMKFCAVPIVRRFGFRDLLVRNSVVLGLLSMGFAFLQAGTPIAIFVAVLSLSGFLRSLQFTCMNALTYADLDQRQMSGGTAIASVAMQISLSLGVAFGATLLHFATRITGAATPEPHAFALVFLAIGTTPFAASLIFARLSPDAGSELRGRPDAVVAETPKRAAR